MKKNIKNDNDQKSINKTVSQKSSNRNTPVDRLHRSERFFKEITEHSSDIIIITDKNGDVKYCSRSVERFLGYQPEELIGKSAFTFIHSDDVERAANDYRRAIVSGLNTIIPNSFRVLHKNGSIIYLDGLGRNLLDNPDVSGFVMNVRDNSERRKTEDELKKSEAKYRLLADHVRDYVWLMDLNLNWTYISPSGERLLGYTLEELKQLPLNSLLSETSFQLAQDTFSIEMSKERVAPLPPSFQVVLELECRCKDGREILVESTLSFIRDEKGKPINILGEGRDITERKKAEEALRKSEEKYRELVKYAPSGIYELNFDTGRLTSVNDVICEYTEYTRDELLNMNLFDLFAQESLGTLAKRIKKLQAGETISPNIEYVIITKSGKQLWIQMDTRYIYEDGKLKRAEGIIHNITEIKQAEEKLRQSEAKYRHIFDNAPAAIYQIDFKTGKFLKANDVFCEYIGCSQEEITSLNPYDILTDDSKKLFSERMEKISQGLPVPDTVEYEILDKKGKRWTLQFHNKNIYDAEGRLVAADVVANDITERKKVEEDLKKSEAQYRLLADNITEHIWLRDINSLKIIYISPSVEKMYGYPVEEIRKIPLKKLLTKESFQDMIDKFITEMPKALNTLPPSVHKYSFETQAYHKDGHLLWIDNTISFIRDENGNISLLLGETRDITARKQAEELLKAREKQYRILADNVTDIIFSMDMNFRFTYISPSVYRILGYTVDELIEMKIYETVSHDTLNFLSGIFLKELEMEEKNDRDLTRSWIAEYQYIHKSKSTIWVETTFTFLRDESNRAVGVLGVTRDISKRKQAEMDLADSMGRLRKGLNATIEAMVSAVEIRDPYTAGHQFRTSELAFAIGKEMGLPNEILEGIRMAGSIHDIGKLSIPTEILSKPTRLTDIEQAIIQKHSQNGYEILKNIESPWPLAQIIQQHHERMDGSGYPKKLKGDEIILEARIVAVADLIEAVASHRPYRESIGIENALEEIEKNRGILYDDAVADACLRLFREKGYKIM